MYLRLVCVPWVLCVFVSACGADGADPLDGGDTAALEDSLGRADIDDTVESDTDTVESDTDTVESDTDTVESDTTPDSVGAFTPLCGEDETESITASLATSPPDSGKSMNFRAIVNSCLTDDGIVGHVYLRYVHFVDSEGTEEVLCGQRFTFRTTGAAVDPRVWRTCTDCPHAFAGVVLEPPTPFGNYCDVIQRGGTTHDISIYTGGEVMVFGQDDSGQACAFMPHQSPSGDRYWRNIADSYFLVTGSNFSGGWLSAERKSCRYISSAGLKETYP